MLPQQTKESAAGTLCPPWQIGLTIAEGLIFFVILSPNISSWNCSLFFASFGFLVGSLGFWAFPFLSTMNHRLLLPARLSSILHNSLTKLSVFSNDFICSLILFACFASQLLIFRILFSILIMPLFDASPCSWCIFLNVSRDFLISLVSLYAVGVWLFPGFISFVFPVL